MDMDSLAMGYGQLCAGRVELLTSKSDILPLEHHVALNNINHHLKYLNINGHILIMMCSCLT